MSVRRRASGRTHYNYFRDYDPAKGGYVQSDPIGLKAGINTYLYAMASPVGSDDPYGLLRRGRGCSKVGWSRVQYAESRIRRELKKPCEGCKSDLAGSCIPCDIRQKVLNALDASVVNCFAPPLPQGYCGEAPVFGKTVDLQLAAFSDPKCGCLALVVLHELLHNIGLSHEDSGDRVTSIGRSCKSNLCNLVEAGL